MVVQASGVGQYSNTLTRSLSNKQMPGIVASRRPLGHG